MKKHNYLICISIALLMILSQCFIDRQNILLVNAKEGINNYSVSTNHNIQIQELIRNPFYSGLEETALGNQPSQTPVVENKEEPETIENQSDSSKQKEPTEESENKENQPSNLQPEKSEEVKTGESENIDGESQAPILSRKTRSVDPSANSQEEQVIEINSFDDLKNYLEFKTVESLNIRDAQIDKFVLKSGHYKIMDNFSIDINDTFFQGKEENIKYGIINSDNSVMIDGLNHTISLTADKSAPLFGNINAPKFSIENLNVQYEHDVYGYSFAQALCAYEIDEANMKVNGVLHNISVKVKGSVLPLKAVGKVVQSNNFAGNYQGFISSGFAWYIENVNINKLNVLIDKNIGDTKRPEKSSDIIAAYGLTHHFGSGVIEPNSQMITEKIKKGHPEVLKEMGSLTEFTLVVKGNIQAYGNDMGFTAGVGQDMAECWMDKLNIHVEGDILTDLSGKPNGYYTNVYQAGGWRSFALGVSLEVMNLTNSQFEFQNISLNSENLTDAQFLVEVGAIANHNSKTYYSNFENNTVTVKGSIQGKTNISLLAWIGYNDGTNGNEENWVRNYKSNKFNIGSISLSGTKAVSYNGLSAKWRTGRETPDHFVFPEATFENNYATVGDVNIESEGEISVSLMMYNISNAKNNQLKYGNVTIKGNSTQFYGLGTLRTDRPAINYYSCIASDNHITINSLNINSQDVREISLLGGYQDQDQVMENCSSKVGNVNVTLNSNNVAFNVIGGITSYSQGPIKSCRVFAGSITIHNSGKRQLLVGLGAGFMYGSSMKDSGAFVDEKLEVKGPGYVGGFAGFATGSSLENNDYQIDGKNTFNQSIGNYGGFAGYLQQTSLKSNRSLILNDFAPAIGTMEGGTIDDLSYYTNGAFPENTLGLIVSAQKSPKINNSTLLVEKENQDRPLFLKNDVSKESKNNYLVVVDNSGKNECGINRIAYSTDYVTKNGVEWCAKVGEPLAKVGIAQRSFQNQYWTQDFQSEILETGANSQGIMFSYESSNPQKITFERIGIDKEVILGNEGILKDYFHRHAGIKINNGPVMDLLGIKGSEGQIEVRFHGELGKPDLQTVHVCKGKTVPKNSVREPTREGYDFVGWYYFAKDEKSFMPRQASPEKPYSFSKKIYNDVDIYAKWKKKKEEHYDPKIEEKPLIIPSVEDKKEVPKTSDGDER